ncbi:MAG: hypothetical protein AABY09_01645, partial [Nanoarchaeota archaeon]
INITPNDGVMNGTSNATALAFIIDNIQPLVELNEPTDAYSTTASPVLLKWTATDTATANMTCNVTLDGSVAVSGVGSLNGTEANYSASVSDGTHYWNVTCKDITNHMNTSVTRSFSKSTPATPAQPSGGGGGNGQGTPSQPEAPPATPPEAVPETPTEAPPEAAVLPPEEIAQQVIEETRQELGEMAGVADAIFQNLPPAEPLAVQGHKSEEGIEVTIGEDAVLSIALKEDKPEIRTDFGIGTEGLSPAQYSELPDTVFIVPAYILLVVLSLFSVNLISGMLKGMSIMQRIEMKDAVISALEHNFNVIHKHSTLELYESSMRTFTKFLSEYLKVDADDWKQVRLKLERMGADRFAIDELGAVYKSYMRRVRHRKVSREELVALIVKLKYIAKSI